MKVLLVAVLMAAAVPLAQAGESGVKNVSSVTTGTYVDQPIVGWHWYN